MPGLDWFTLESQLRAAEIYLSFHPNESEKYEKIIAELKRKIKEGVQCG